MPNRTLRRTAELSVDDIHEITWDTAAFHSLVIPEEKKEVIQALVEGYTSSIVTSLNDLSGVQFRDIIQGKGRSLVILLQYIASAPRILRSANFYLLVVPLGLERL